MGQRYHKGIALIPKLKGYILSNEQLAARSKKSQVQWQPKSNDGSRVQSPLIPKSVSEREQQTPKFTAGRHQVYPEDEGRMVVRLRRVLKATKEEANEANEGKGNEGNKCHLVACWKKKCPHQSCNYFKLSSLFCYDFKSLHNKLYSHWLSKEYF